MVFLLVRTSPATSDVAGVFLGSTRLGLFAEFSSDDLGAVMQAGSAVLVARGSDPALKQ